MTKQKKKQTQPTKSFLTPLDIPEGRSGEWEIRHRREPVGFCTSLASPRTIILGGDAPGRIQYAQPTRWHLLLENGQTWMSDLPIEQYQIDNCLANVHQGSVLIGGLGLGYAVTALAMRPRIRRIIVVEKAKEVVELVEPHLLKGAAMVRGKVEVVTADLFDYLKDLHKQEQENPILRPAFTHAFFDIWTGDGEATFFETVCPLLRLADGVVLNRPICWNENVMRGQLTMSLQSRLMLPEKIREWANTKGNIWWDWSVPFFQWIQGRLEEHPHDTDLELRAAKAYAACYGLPRRELIWTSFIEKKEEESGGVACG